MSERDFTYLINFETYKNKLIFLLTLLINAFLHFYILNGKLWIGKLFMLM